MNHLAHFYLSQSHEALIVGGFLGDFVKGRLTGKFPTAIEEGIRLHRAIDSYTDTHPVVTRSRTRFDPPYRRYSGIITDIVYDHYLARNWQTHSSVSLESFNETACRCVLQAKPLLPETALETITWMQSAVAFVRYADETFIDRALKSISRRLRRDNPLATGIESFQQNRPGLEEDFTLFMPQVTQFAEQWISDNL